MKNRINKTQRRRTIQEFSTSALPDIVFMLLFFFMVTTVVNDEHPLMDVKRPSARQVEKIEQNDLCSTLLIGYRGANRIPLIQLDDRFIEVADVGRLIAEKRAALPEALAPKFTTILKADKTLPMDIVIRVKQELRKVNALKIQYSVVDENVL